MSVIISIFFIVGVLITGYMQHLKRMKEPISGLLVSLSFMFLMWSFIPYTLAAVVVSLAVPEFQNFMIPILLLVAFLFGRYEYRGDIILANNVLVWGTLFMATMIIFIMPSLAGGEQAIIDAIKTLDNGG